MIDLSKLSEKELLAILKQIESDSWDKKVAKARKEEQAKMMDERSTLDNVLAAIGKSGVDLGRGFSQLFGGMSRQEVDEARRLDAPLMDTKAGKFGNIAGDIALSMIPMGAGALATTNVASKALPRLAGAVNALPSVNTVAGGAALGGAMGLTRPVGEDDSRFANTAMGVLAGGAIPAGVAGYRGVKAALDPMTQAGRDRIAGRMLERFATDPQQAAQRLAVAKSNVPGVAPTVGEATLDPGLNTLERSMFNFPGPMQGAATARQASNNAARQSFLESISGTADDVARLKDSASSAYQKGIDAVGQITADVNTPKTVQLIDRILKSPQAESKTLTDNLKAVRAQFFEPYPAEERLKAAWQTLREALDKAGTKRISTADFNALEEARKATGSALRRVGRDEPQALADEALARLYGIEAKNKLASTAIDDARTLLAADNVAFKRDPARLAEVYKTLNERIGKLDPKSDVSTIKALTAVKRSLANWMDAAAGYKGGYSNINRQYSAAMKEVERMEALQSMKVSGVPSATIDVAGNPVMGAKQLNLSQFLQATDPARKVRIGNRSKALGDILDPARRDALETLRGEAARVVEASKMGKAHGSPTAQFLYAQNLLGEILGPMGLPTSLADRAIGAVTSLPVIGAGLAGANRLAGRQMAEHVGEVMMNPQRAAQLMGAAQAQSAQLMNPGVSRLLPPTLAGIAGGMFGPGVGQQEPPYGARW